MSGNGGIRQYVTRKAKHAVPFRKVAGFFSARRRGLPAFAAGAACVRRRRACFVFVAAANMASSLTLALLSHSPLLPQESPLPGFVILQ